MRALIERMSGAPTDRLAALLAESEQQGFRFVRRLVEEWESGANRFDRPGEALFVARVGNDVVGVCGLHVDPYADDPKIGRVRHLYVLVPHLRTANATAARLYERLGFRRTAARDHTHVLDVD